LPDFLLILRFQPCFRGDFGVTRAHFSLRAIRPLQRLLQAIAERLEINRRRQRHQRIAAFVSRARCSS